MSATKQPVDFEFGDDLSASEAEIRARAHIVNGGDAATFPCPKCNGSGRFISWSGRDSGPCFKCKGEGKVGKMVAAAAKGKITKQRNIEAWQAENADLIAAVRNAAKWSTFAQSLLSSLDTYGKWTENQVTAARSSLVKRVHGAG